MNSKSPGKAASAGLLVHLGVGVGRFELVARRDHRQTGDYAVHVEAIRRAGARPHARSRQLVAFSESQRNETRPRRSEFRRRQCEECLMSNAEALLGKVRRKYKEYGIQEKPFIIVKADAGTYGMGIMTVRDPKDLADLNRRSRNKMSVIKDGQEVSEVMMPMP